MIESLIASGTITIRAACHAFGVSESGFYAHRHKPQRPRRQQDDQIAQEMKEVFEQNYQCYGSPRLVKALRNRGLRCGKTRIRRLMKQEGLCPKQKRRFRPRTTQSHPYLSCAPNVIAVLPSVAAPSERFHSDITYIPTKEGFLYLAATIDAFTRRCAGWSARDNMETQLVKEAASMAFGICGSSNCGSSNCGSSNCGSSNCGSSNCGSSNCEMERIHHSDQGSQYASEDFRRLLEKEQILQSMSRKGNCYDNALSESFWATVKTECFDNFRHGMPQTRAEALRSLFHYIELFYNRERMHSALGYKSPLQFEKDWTQRHFTVQIST